MSEIRYAEKAVFSTDDSAVPITIIYPAPLRPHEIEDLKEFFAIWIRSMERRAKRPITQTSGWLCECGIFNGAPDWKCECGRTRTQDNGTAR